MTRLLAMLAPLLLAGCATTVPFAEPVLPPLGEVDAATVFHRHFAAAPARFTADLTIVVEWPWRQLATLGCARVDRRDGTFELLAMTHMGFKLFHLAGDRQTAKVLFAAPPLSEHPEFLAALAADVRDLYLDSPPPATAETTIGDDAIRLLAPAANGEVEYRFGGADLRLLRKRFYSGWGWRWATQIRYYEYDPDLAVEFPRGVVVDNRPFGYRLILKHRSWQAVPETEAKAP